MAKVWVVYCILRKIDHMITRLHCIMKICHIRPVIIITGPFCYYRDPWNCMHWATHKRHPNLTLINVLCGVYCEYFWMKLTSIKLHKGQWPGALMFSMICTWINSRVNNCEAGDLRRHHAHYDVIVMIFDRSCINTWQIWLWFMGCNIQILCTVKSLI